MAVLLRWGMALTTVAASAPQEALDMGTAPSNTAEVPSVTKYNEALKNLDIESVMKDLENVMTESQEWWPADYGNYGPFFIRLAWHCSGTYRDSDGRGGCGGGRQRFDPEKSWDDNANLDKARALVWPIKEKYGDALSWGDLFTLAGTTAIKSMGGPILPPCVGRIDSNDGTESLSLGPSDYQEKVAPCAKNGQCKSPLGSYKVGLIYLDPEGPLEEDENGEMHPNPDPAKTAKTVRDAFGRMGFNTEETLALIGGGHTFGKSHGACEAGTGPAPHWVGKCGTGIGKDTFTSGIEGAWTTKPLEWDNEFWKVLVEQENNWEKFKGPGGHWQWRIKGATGDMANIMRMTSDIALLHDPQYKKISQKWATDVAHFDKVFARAWRKLMTNGGRWADNRRCLGDGPSQLWMREDDAVATEPSHHVEFFAVGTACGVMFSMLAFVLIRRRGKASMDMLDSASE